MARKTSTSPKAKPAQDKAQKPDVTDTAENKTPAPSPEQGPDAAARQSAAEPAASKDTPPESDAGKGAPETAGAPDMAMLSAALTSEAGEAKAPKVAQPEPTQAATDARNLVVVVIGPKKGLWRAGRHFTSEPVRIPAHELTEGEAHMLRDEPKLAISLVQAEPDEA